MLTNFYKKKKNLKTFIDKKKTISQLKTPLN